MNAFNPKQHFARKREAIEFPDSVLSIFSFQIHSFLALLFAIVSYDRSKSIQKKDNYVPTQKKIITPLFWFVSMCENDYKI